MWLQEMDPSYLENSQLENNQNCLKSNKLQISKFNMKNIIDHNLPNMVVSGYP